MTLTELIEKLSAIRQVHGGQVEVVVNEDGGEGPPDPRYVPPARFTVNRPAKVTL